jgi:hypothetical protein
MNVDAGEIDRCWLAGHKDEAEYNPWRLQELPDPILRILGPADEPAYGRRYDVFYNQIKVGDLEIKPHWDYRTVAASTTTHQGMPASEQAG